MGCRAMKKITLAALCAASAFGAVAAPASADPVLSVCGSVQVTVNGQDVVNNATCQVLPPE